MFFSFFILSSVFIFTANGWGPIGHSLVARIAQSLLTNNSAKFVRDHLPWYTYGDLSMLSSWPDNILYPDTNPVDYLNWQWSKQLHYVNTPDWKCNYNPERDCNSTDGQRCVDRAIQNYTGRLADTKQDDIQRQEALKFLVHFIGDVHQPLHAGFAGDQGGNTIHGKIIIHLSRYLSFLLGTFFNNQTKLHKIWDTDMINHRLVSNFNDNTNEYYNYLLNILHTTYATNISQWSKCPSSDEAKSLACSTAWIHEDIELDCAHVYRDENNKPMSSSEEFHLGKIYYNTNLVFLEQRLLQSGVRLGMVINKIVELQKHHHEDDDNDQLCSGTVYLFVIILLEILLLFFGITYYLVRRRVYREPLSEKPPEYNTINNTYKS
jgi:hypothetical protein